MVADVPCVQIPVPDGGTVQVTGILRDGKTKAPIAGAMVAVEYGGLYLQYCDLTQASPFYVFGAITDAAGAFTLTARAGALGFHSFANGYYYSREPLDTAKSTSVVIEALALPPTQKLPLVSAAGFDTATVAPGATVTFAATLATWKPTDPLSDENILLEPTGSFALELAPPRGGQKDNFPDGVWKTSFAAPAVAGTYTYWFSATTAGCVTSSLSSYTLTVQ